MSVFQTPGGRRGSSIGPTAEPTRAELIQKFWTFLRGLATTTLRITDGTPTAGQMLVASDTDGNTSFSSTLPATSFTDSAETASQTGTLIASASGEYLITVYAQCTTAGAAGTLDADVTYTDEVGLTTLNLFTGLSLAGTGRTQATAVIRCAGGGIDYTFTVTGGAGAQYAAHFHATKLRG